MCARRFLGCRLRPDPARRGGGFAIFQWGGDVLLKQAVPKGHFQAAAAGGGPDYAQSRRAGSRGPGWPTTLALAARRRHRRPRAAMPPSSTSTRPPISSATAGTRRSTMPATPHSAPICSCTARRARSTAPGRSGRRATARRRSARSCSTSEDAQQALDLAYGDVAAAFDQFVKEAGDRPIILAGHSQGALHLERLLQEKIAGKPIAKRVVAAYVVGWPISTTADLPALGLPACAAPRPDRLHPVVDELRRTRQPRPDPQALDKTQGPDRRRAAAGRTCCASIRSPAAQDGAAPAEPIPAPWSRRADLSSATLAAGHGRRALRQGPADRRRRDPAARPVRAAGQQLSRL